MPGKARDANGEVLQVGDCVTASWKAGKNVYFGVIESFSKNTKIANGTWTEGRRKCDGNTFSIGTTSLLKVPPQTPKQPGKYPMPCLVLLDPYGTPKTATALAEEKVGRQKFYRVRYESGCEVSVNGRYVSLQPVEKKFSTESNETLTNAKSFPRAENNLEKERERLLELAADAPSSGWIETGKVKGREFRQAWWRGIPGPKKTLYIGKVNSPEYKRARAAQKARAELRKVEREIAKLKGKS